MSVAHEATPDRAIDALTWAAEVAGDPTLLDQKRERPTPAEWRSVPLPVFREHMDRLLTSKHPEPGLDAVESVGCLDAWLPEVAAMVGFGDNEWRHKDAASTTTAT
jgi:poly(A) polymerase